MSVSAVAPTPFYQDPDRLQIGMPQAVAEDGAPAAEGSHLSMFAEGDDSPSFWDVLDIINPLQHIPIVNDIYRDLTGDKIGVGARLLGATLLGGPVGLIASAANCAVEESTGKDAGRHVLALFDYQSPGAPDDAPATQFAEAEAAPSPVADAPVPEKPAQAVAANAAPVIDLPTAGKSTAAASRTAIYSLDGAPAAAPAAVMAPPSVTAQPIVPVATQPVAAVAAVSQTTQPAKLMPVPARTNVDPRNAPMLMVPVSTSQNRSSVPITGRAPDSAVSQRVVANQSVPADHPMVPPADAAGQNAASPDWFSSAWSEALDKYQRANNRNTALTGGSSLN